MRGWGGKKAAGGCNRPDPMNGFRQDIYVFWRAGGILHVHDVREGGRGKGLVISCSWWIWKEEKCVTEWKTNIMISKSIWYLMLANPSVGKKELFEMMQHFFLLLLLLLFSSRQLIRDSLSLSLDSIVQG
jgi:hypothetical protein